MSSPGNGKFRYFKERFVNACRLLRQGRFTVFWDMLRMEAEHQCGMLRDRSKDSTGPDSEYVDKHKLSSPSYQPTVLKVPTNVTLQSDPEAVRAELGKILSSLNVRERY